jgi:hypothetical protein
VRVCALFFLTREMESQKRARDIIDELFEEARGG